MGMWKPIPHFPFMSDTWKFPIYHVKIKNNYGLHYLPGLTATFRTYLSGNALPLLCGVTNEAAKASSFPFPYHKSSLFLNLVLVPIESRPPYFICKQTSTGCKGTKNNGLTTLLWNFFNEFLSVMLCLGLPPPYQKPICHRLKGWLQARYTHRRLRPWKPSRFFACKCFSANPARSRQTDDIRRKLHSDTYGRIFMTNRKVTFYPVKAYLWQAER